MARWRRTPKYLLQFGLWLSLVERLVRDQEAVGSNPTSPIRAGLIWSSRNAAAGWAYALDLNAAP